MNAAKMYVFLLAFVKDNNFLPFSCSSSIIHFLQGAEYEVLDDSQEHWWKVKDEQG
jgi:hypothetical protein